MFQPCKMQKGKAKNRVVVARKKWGCMMIQLVCGWMYDDTINLWLRFWRCEGQTWSYLISTLTKFPTTYSPHVTLPQLQPHKIFFKKIVFWKREKHNIKYDQIRSEEKYSVWGNNSPHPFLFAAMATHAALASTRIPTTSRLSSKTSPHSFPTQVSAKVIPLSVFYIQAKFIVVFFWVMWILMEVVFLFGTCRELSLVNTLGWD